MSACWEPSSNALARRDYAVDPVLKRLQAVADNGVNAVHNFVTGQPALMSLVVKVSHIAVAKTPHIPPGKLFFEIQRDAPHVAQKHRFVLVKKILELGQSKHEIREAHPPKDSFRQLWEIGNVFRILLEKA